MGKAEERKRNLGDLHRISVAGFVVRPANHTVEHPQSAGHRSCTKILDAARLMRSSRPLGLRNICKQRMCAAGGTCTLAGRHPCTMLPCRESAVPTAGHGLRHHGGSNFLALPTAAGHYPAVCEGGDAGRDAGGRGAPDVCLRAEQPPAAAGVAHRRAHQPSRGALPGPKRPGAHL